MAKVIAVTKSAASLADVESRFGLSKSIDQDFFPEWRASDGRLSTTQEESLAIAYRRLQYHRADSEPLEGAVTLLLVAPLLELAGFYDPPFKLRSEASVAIPIDDGEEILKGKIDALILRDQLWVLVLEANKTTVPLRSALPQLLSYWMANPRLESSNLPTYGVVTNGDEVLFIKLVREPSQRYSLSRAFSIYTDYSELYQVLVALQAIGHRVV